MKPEKMQTNPDILPTKQIAKEKLNDIGFRVILIPFFGIVIPVITGMIDSDIYKLWQLKLGYLYTIAIHSLFELKSWRLIFINGGYSVVALTLMGAIIGLWR